MNKLTKLSITTTIFPNQTWILFSTCKVKKLLSNKILRIFTTPNKYRNKNNSLFNTKIKDFHNLTFYNNKIKIEIKQILLARMKTIFLILWKESLLHIIHMKIPWFQIVFNLRKRISNPFKDKPYKILIFKVIN